MKLLLLSVVFVVILTGIRSAPKTDKACNQCRPKKKDIKNEVCGLLDGTQKTFYSLRIFQCIAKCRKAREFKIVNEGKCVQTKTQCIFECDQKIPLAAPPACEGDEDGLITETYPFEAVLDCYSKCPDTNLNKLHQGPCIQDRFDSQYSAYNILAPYDICYKNYTSGCQARRVRAKKDYLSIN